MKSDFFVVVTQPSSIVTLRTWDDPLLYELDGMSTANLPSGSFMELPMFHTYADNPSRGEFGAISHFQQFNKNPSGIIPELEYLKSIQPSDESIYGYSLKNKLNWLLGAPESDDPVAQIYWSQNGAWNESFCTSIRFGTLGFGGQKLCVEVDAEGNKKIYRLWGKYRNKLVSEWISFYKIIGFRKIDMRRPIPELLAEGRIQVCTCANKGVGAENVYTETLKGRVYSPIWSPYDWSTNNGNTLYLAVGFTKI